MKKIKNNQRAFTLSEVMMGMFLLGILLVTVSGVFMGGISGVKKSEKKITNITLAETMLDNILLIPYDDIKAGSYPPDSIATTPSGPFPPLPYPAGIPEGSGTKYTYKINVSIVPDTGGELKSITVNVISEGAGGEGARYTLTTFKAK